MILGTREVRLLENVLSGKGILTKFIIRKRNCKSYLWKQKRKWSNSEEIKSGNCRSWL